MIWLKFLKCDIWTNKRTDGRTDRREVQNSYLDWKLLLIHLVLDITLELYSKPYQMDVLWHFHDHNGRRGWFDTQGSAVVCALKIKVHCSSQFSINLVLILFYLLQVCLIKIQPNDEGVKISERHFFWKEYIPNLFKAAIIHGSAQTTISSFFLVIYSTKF